MIQKKNKMAVYEGNGRGMRNSNVKVRLWRLVIPEVKIVIQKLDELQGNDSKPILLIKQKSSGQ